MSKSIHVGCCVLCYILPNLTSDMVLGMDWLHMVNPLIEWNAKSLYIEFGGRNLFILGTKSSCSHASVEVCALKSVLKTM